MRSILVLFDTLNRKYLPSYGCEWTKLPSFTRMGEKCAVFDNFYGGSLPCMPARRELHTGRYNFLHTPWSPMQPFDDSLITRMRHGGVYAHIVTDHFHYWEDGGSGYLTKFDSHEMIRGQQGDPWIGQVSEPETPETLSRRKGSDNWKHDWINRSFLTREEDMPQAKVFSSALDFIDRNAGDDNWFLQIEAFDPHEPFFTQSVWKKLYDDKYSGKNLDWPDYGKNHYGDEATEHVKYEYAALLSMCDHYLGTLLDKMDELDMWKDTMLIVMTDHGFMLGEKEWMGKNIQPIYDELVHNPFYIHDPRHPEADGMRREALAQTIDLVPTLASYFDVDAPDHLDGYDLEPVIISDGSVREGALFGVFGGQVNVTDGRYVYMHGPIKCDNSPLDAYTLMPMHMRSLFKVEELKDVELFEGPAYLEGAKVLKVNGRAQINPYWYGTRLYDLEKDPEELEPIRDDEVERRLLELMRELMIKNEAPAEQFERLGIPITGDFDSSLIESYHKLDLLGAEEVEGLDESGKKVLAVIAHKVGRDVVEKAKGLGLRIGSDVLAALPGIIGAERAASLAGLAELYI